MIPLEIKTKSVILCRSCHIPASRHFLRHGKHICIPVKDGIHLSDKIQCFKVFTGTIYIRDPLSFFPVIIQVQHGCKISDLYAVHVIFFSPETDRRQQEGNHFGSSVIENMCGVRRVNSFSGIQVLIQARAVIFRQQRITRRKIGSHKIYDNTDTASVKVIHHIHELLRISVAGCGGKISAHLISLTPVLWVFSHGRKLYMGVSHGFHIFGKCFRNVGVAAVIPVSGPLSPFLKAALIYSHWISLRG